MTDFDMTDAKPEKAPKKNTVLDRLREKLSAQVTRPEVLIEVPARPDITILVSPNIDQSEIKAWRKRAGEGTKNGFDANKFARVIIAGTCRGIFMDGEEAFTEEGNPLTFASPPIQEMLSAADPFDAVKKLYALDPHLEAAAGAILDAAGYGDEVNVVDPTKASLTT